MKNPRPFHLLAGILVVTATVASCLSPSTWFTVTGGDGQKALEAQSERADELDSLAEYLSSRSSTHNEVTTRLLTGELTLFEAAALFRSLNDRPPFSEDYRYIYRGDSDEEKVC